MGGLEEGFGDCGFGGVAVDFDEGVAVAVVGDEGGGGVGVDGEALADHVGRVVAAAGEGAAAGIADAIAAGKFCDLAEGGAAVFTAEA